MKLKTGEMVWMTALSVTLAATSVAANSVGQQAQNQFAHETVYSEVLDNPKIQAEFERPSVSKHDERVERFRNLNMTRERPPN